MTPVRSTALHRLGIVLLAAALLAFPLFGLLVLEFRPDALSALLTAAGALTIAADLRWREGDRKTVIIAASGAALGIALARWVARLLVVAISTGGTLVELQIVESVSHETVRQVLKQTASSRG